MKKTKIFAGLAWTWIGLAFPLAATQVGGPARHELAGHLPPISLTQRRVGPVPDGQVLHLLLGLRPPDPAAIAQRVRDTYDPSSPLYRHFLTPKQFGDAFGLSDSDYQKVLAFAAREGLTVGQSYRSRLQVSVHAPAAVINKAFGVKLGIYLRGDGSEFYAPDREPSVEDGLPLAHISGLDSYRTSPRRPEPRRLPRTRAPHRRSGGGSGAGTGPSGTYIGSDFRNIYMPCTSLDGSGQAVALVEFDNFYNLDITNYASQAGLAIPNVVRRLVDESSAEMPSFEEPEVTLDIEVLSSMAPGAVIIAYEAPDEVYSDNMDLLGAIADDDSAETISSSWYWFGSGDVNAAAIFQQYALQGQTFMSLSGDQGAFGDGGPADQPYEPVIDSSLMTVVGGTTLSTSGAGAGAYVSETTWNFSPGPAATQTPAVNAVSGGGSCVNGGTVLLAIPTYQVPFVNAQNGASSTGRNIPDVALTASNIFFTYNNGFWGTSGGTSAATPLWAGVVALANQEAALLGQAPVGFLNPTLYQLASSPSTYAADFHDINDGSNNSYWGNTPDHYQAVTGYDLCTGLGSPQCALIYGLLGVTPTFTPSPSFTASPSVTVSPSATETSTASPSSTVSLTFTVSQTYSASPTFSATGTASPSSSASPSLTVSQTYTPSPTFSASPSATDTPLPTLTPTPSSAQGPDQILQVAPVPNPDPSSLAVLLAGEADAIDVRIYSRAFVRVETMSVAGPFMAGWNKAALPRNWSGRLAQGVYFAIVRPRRKGQEGSGPAPAKLMLLR